MYMINEIFMQFWTATLPICGILGTSKYLVFAVIRAYGDLVHSQLQTFSVCREVEMSKNFGYLNEDTAEVVLPLLVEHMDSW